jgi:uncharacterized protein (TIGR01777 family)
VRIVVTGGTGAIGRHLLPELARRGSEVVALTRSPDVRRRWMSASVRRVAWDAASKGEWAHELGGADAVIHLAGQGIFDRRWSRPVKQELRESRIRSTRLLAEAICVAAEPPALLVCASAVGYYGDTGDGVADESHPAGSDFLAQLCVDWENEARAIAPRVRVASPRLGIVLQHDGGALARMLPAFRAFAGGYFGSGRSWFPWVHVDDVVAAILRPLDDAALAGPYNVVAPGIVRFREFAQALARALHRPCWRIPEAAVRLGLGEAAGALLASQHVVPKSLLGSGFAFRHPTLDAALAALLAPGARRTE